MRRTLSLLALALVITACADAVAPAPATEAVLARGGQPGGPGEPLGIQSLAASINGPGSVGNYTTCTFTSTVSGGTPPYSYSWSIVGATNGYLSLGSTTSSSVQATGYYYGSWGGTGSVYLILTVTDANSLQASPSKQVLIPYSSTSC
jgi:hypothetical protein